MASGETLLIWTHPTGFPTSNPPAFGTRNTHPVWEFDGSTEQSAHYESVLPRHYAGGGLTAKVHCLAKTATSGNVVLGGSVERMHAAGDDLDADSFATEQLSSSTAVDATSGKVFVITLTFTAGANMDSLAAGEAFRFKLARKVGDAGDDMSGFLQVTKIELYET